jgi:hypothetical protein
LGGYDTSIEGDAEMGAGDAPARPDY